MTIQKAGLSLHSYRDISIGGREKSAPADLTRANRSSFAKMQCSQCSAAVGKTDRIEISGRPENDGKVYDSLRQQIKNGVNADSSPAKLEKLKSSIEGGNYPVHPEEMAQILLTVPFRRTGS